MKKSVLAQVLLSVIAITSLMLTPVSAQVEPPPPPDPQDDLTSSAAPRGETIVYATAPQSGSGGVNPAANEDILLIQTSDPWEDSYVWVGNNSYDGITADTTELNSLGYTYRIATWNDINIGAVNIFSYPVVLIVNDQVQSFYDDYAAHVADFENYVSTGHTLLFFAAGYGWARGVLNAPLPGGVAWNLSGMSDVASFNQIVNPTHPIISARLSNQVPLTGGDLYSNYCSHGWFSNMPGNTDVILRESASEGGNPTLIEYHIGNGRVIASTLTWEHNWAYHTGGDSYGTFSRKALDDVFLYAVSGGTLPTEVKVTLGIDDATNNTTVNKSRGSFVDVVARINGEDAYQVNVVLQVPSDKFGAPVETFTRNRPDNGGYGQKNQYASPGSGQYQVSTILNLLSAPRNYHKEIVWRFAIPDNAAPEPQVNLSATISVPGHTVQNPTSSARLNIIDYARSLIVTNRTLLFQNYGLNTATNDVTPLLQYVYQQAIAWDGEVFYVDLYNDAARGWNQSPDYTSETTANVVAVAIDGYALEGWHHA